MTADGTATERNTGRDKMRVEFCHAPSLRQPESWATAVEIKRRYYLAVGLFEVSLMLESRPRPVRVSALNDWWMP
jgi:hypothetical protein